MGKNINDTTLYKHSNFDIFYIVNNIIVIIFPFEIILFEKSKKCSIMLLCYTPYTIIQ